MVYAGSLGQASQCSTKVKTKTRRIKKVLLKKESNLRSKSEVNNLRKSNEFGLKRAG